LPTFSKPHACCGWIYEPGYGGNSGEMADGVEIYCNFLNEPGNWVYKPASVYDED
jgi:hypothetical protein